MDWKIHRAFLIAAIWIAEVLAAGICGFIAALALVPASYAARGYYAFGGEWLTYPKSRRRKSRQA